MGLSDRLKDLRTKAEDAVVERKDQIQQTVQKVSAAADERTGGKYHDRIEQVGGKTSGFVDQLQRERGGGVGGAGEPQGEQAADDEPQGGQPAGGEPQGGQPRRGLN
jgi:hypothetical protein